MRRDGQIQPVPARELVRGDVLYLEAGNLEGLSVDEAALTAESMPVEKVARLCLEGLVPLAECRNMVYLGTAVINLSVGLIMKEAATDGFLWSPSTIQHQVSFRQFSGSYSVIKLQFGFQVQMAFFRTRSAESLGGNMKTTHLLATLIAATLPLTAVLAEDTAKTETTDQKQEQSSDTSGMKGMDMDQMMSNSKDQDAELDKLVAEMNSASADKKLDAIAAVLTKLVEQRKAMPEQMQKMMSANDKEGMGMCRMMGCCDPDGKHSHHH